MTRIRLDLLYGHPLQSIILWFMVKSWLVWSGRVWSFLLLQQTAVQSSILILSYAVDRILQTCSVVKNSAATIQTDMAVSDGDAWKLWLTIIATCDKCQWPQQLMAKSDVYNWWHHIYKNHLLFQTGRWRMFKQPGITSVSGQTSYPRGGLLSTEATLSSLYLLVKLDLLLHLFPAYI